MFAHLSVRVWWLAPCRARPTYIHTYIRTHPPLLHSLCRPTQTIFCGLRQEVYFCGLQQVYLTTVTLRVSLCELFIPGSFTEPLIAYEYRYQQRKEAQLVYGFRARHSFTAVNMFGLIVPFGSSAAGGTWLAPQTPSNPGRYICTQSIYTLTGCTWRDRAELCSGCSMQELKSSW